MQKLYSLRIQILQRLAAHTPNESTGHGKNIARIMEKNEELNKKLVEANTTISHLRDDLKSARNSSRTVRHHSDTEEKHERENVETRAKAQDENRSSAHHRIPLEPHVEIVNPTTKPNSTKDTGRSEKVKIRLF